MSKEIPPKKTAEELQSIIDQNSKIFKDATDAANKLLVKQRKAKAETSVVENKTEEDKIVGDEKMVDIATLEGENVEAKATKLAELKELEEAKKTNDETMSLLKTKLEESKNELAKLDIKIKSIQETENQAKLLAKKKKAEAELALSKLKKDEEAIKIKIAELISHGYPESEAKLQADYEEILNVAEKRKIILENNPEVKASADLLKNVDIVIKKYQNEISKLKEKFDSENALKKDKKPQSLEEFSNLLSSLLYGAIEKHLSDDPEFKKIAEEIVPLIIRDSAKEYDSISEEQEKQALAELTATCQNKELFITEIKRIKNEIEKTTKDNEEEKAAINTQTKEIEDDKKIESKDIDVFTVLDKNIEISKEKVEKARAVYFKEYKKCETEAKRQSLIDKTRNSVFNILAGVKNIFSKNKIETKKSIKVEEYFTKETNQAKKEYDEARKEMGNAMFEKQKAVLVKKGLSGDELNKALLNYKSTEILSETILKERQKLIDTKDIPVKQALWKRMLDGYIKLPKWQKIALSTSLFMAAAAAGIVTGGAFAGYGLAQMAAMKFGASMAMGAVVGHSVKGIDLINRKSDLNFAQAQASEELKLKGEFASGNINQTEFEDKLQSLEEEKKKRERNRMLWKAGAGIAIAAVVGFVAYDALGNAIGHPVGSVTSGVDGTTGPDIPHSTVAPIDNIPKIISHANVEAVADHGQGAISTLRELQNNLRTEYGDDLTNAPESVKHILNTDAHDLAREYGMYKPGQNAESVLIKSGQKFMVDQNGNVKFENTLLEKGSELKGTDVYEGRMVDTDQSGIKIETPEPIPQYDPTIPEGSDNLGINELLQHQTDPDIPAPLDETKFATDPNYDGTKAPVEPDQSAVEDQSELTKQEIRQLGRVHNHNINHVFPNNYDDNTWEHLKNNPAHSLFKLNSEEINPEYKGLADYEHKLSAVTGLKPRAAGIFTSAESNNEFIERALKKAAALGKLKEVKL